MRERGLNGEKKNGVTSSPWETPSYHTSDTNGGGDILRPSPNLHHVCAICV